MAITLISGVPGAGKTLRAVSLIVEEVKKGRLVFSDIDGLTVPGVSLAPDDWRTVPDGSLIVYDEVHQRWRATGKAGTSGDPIIQQLDEHRHRGIDFILVTQWPTKLHHEVRTLVDRHYHLMRLAGAQAVTIYEWPYVILDPNDRKERDGGDSKVWQYDKSVYDYYKSSTMHTAAYKFRLPSKLKMYIVIVTILISFIVYRYNTTNSGLINKGSSALQPPAVAAMPQAAAPLTQATLITDDNQWTTSEELPEIAGCISSRNRCQCYSSDGKVLDLDQHTCYTAMDRPLPLAINTRNGRSTKL